MIPHSKPFIHPEDIKAVVKVLESGMLAGGNKVQDFESALAAYIDRRYAAAIPVIEDCAVSLGSELDGVKTGCLGSYAAVFSFYANKIIVAGEGGMVLSDNRDLINVCMTW